MKLSAVSMTKPAFKGYDYVKDSYGEDCYVFNFPHDNIDIETQKANEKEELSFRVDNTNPASVQWYNEELRKIEEKQGYHGYQEKCQVEIVKVVPNEEGLLVPIPETAVKIDIPKEGVAVNLRKLGFRANEDFAYRYVIQGYDNDKAVGKERYAKDVCQDYGNYNVVYRNSLKPTHHGTGYLAIADSFAPAYNFNGFYSENADDIGKIVENPDLQIKAEKVRRTFSNQLGGNIAGLIAKLPYLSEMGVTQLFLLPLMGGDNASYHKYWNENNYQLARGLGEMHNFEDFIEGLFKHQINLVMDAPMTSEGKQGIHYQYALKWGDVNNPFRHWFRMDGIDTNQIGYGIVGKNSETLRHYLVNAPHTFEEINGVIVKKKNLAYEANKPTYIQYYDARFMSEEAIARKQLIDKYDEPLAKDPLAVTTHDDTNIKFAFQLNKEDYEAYERNVDRLNAINRVADEKMSINSKDGTIYLSVFTKTKISDKSAAGVLVWDANTDMIKLRYFESAYDYKSTDGTPVDKYGYTPYNCAIMDSNIKAARFWARKAQLTNYNYVAKTLGDVTNANEAYNRINQLIAEKKLPEKARIDLEALQAVDNYLYELDMPDTSTEHMISKTIMELHFSSLELATDTLGVLATPWFTDSASTGDLIGVSRFDLAEMGNPQISSYLDELYGFKKTYENVNKMFTNEVYNFTLSVLERANDKLPDDKKLFTDESKRELTEFGYYVVKLVGVDIAKYAFMKALAPNTPVRINSKGQIIYDRDFSRANSSLAQLGVKGHTPQYEAELLASKLRNNLREIISDAADINLVKDAVLAKIQNTNVKSHKYAEAVVKNSGVTMDWRIDALKDNEDQDSVRNKKDTFEKTLKNLTFFWKKFKDAIYQETPAAHIWDEITDFSNLGGGMDDELEMLIKTQHTSQADYSFFFTDLLRLLTGDPNKDTKGVAYNNQPADVSAYNAITKPMKTLMEKKFPLDFSRTLYNFGGNHDKPRLSYLMAVNLRLCYANLHNLDSDKQEDKGIRDLALQMITGASAIHELPFDVLFNINDKEYLNKNYFLGASTYAIANGDVIRSKLYDVLHKTNYISLEELDKLHRAVTALVNGDFHSKPEVRASYVDYNTALDEVLGIASQKGFSFRDADLDSVKKQIFELARKSWDYDSNSLKYTKHFEENDYANVPKNILVLANILRSATIQKVNDLKNHYSHQSNRNGLNHNPYENSNDIINKIDSALIEYMNKYSKEDIDAELLAHQEVLMEKQGKEAECFGVSDIREAIRLVFEKAGMADRKLEKFLLFKAIDEPCQEKVLMYNRALVSVPGVATLYAGDEFGLSGHEEKTANLFHQCRNALLWTKLSGIDCVEGEHEYYNQKIKKFREVMNIRKTAKALNNGAFIQLKELTNAKEGLPPEEIKTAPAILTMDTEGNIAVSLFNYYGLSASNKHTYTQPPVEKKEDAKTQEQAKNPSDKTQYINNYIPNMDPIEFDEIKLTPEQSFGLAGLTLTYGMILKNVLEKDGSYYKVVKHGLDYVIRRFNKHGEQLKIAIDNITSSHGVMTIYKNVKRGVPHFHGNKNKTYYNPSFNIVSNPYYFLNEKNAECGKNLSLVSK